ncbi:MAG: peptidase M48, Ste24p [Acidobacteria bacterium OLB17]|nr:MAG: peptidase M48, Ste24p [Acidobacteria bacterium OLB17]MCZ2390470.1 M48 family metallopeptidase [Acidobacteriota bacterium]
MKLTIKKHLAAYIAIFAIAAAPFTAFAQTRVERPKNKYKVSDDVKLGNDNARKVEQQFPILNDRQATRYVSQVGERLVAAIPPQFREPAFDYRFEIVNASDINAFALPGGPMFVNRGMIEAAKNEGEMAGVMAHEISHVALRHATAQATKQGSIGNQLGVIGLILGGAILGGQAGAQLGALGATAWMTKYSRDYETQADTLGAQIMAAAGYDPRDLAHMFQTIQAQSRGGAPEWLSSHPDPGNRYEKIMREAEMLNVNPRPSNDREFRRIQERLRALPPARTMAEIEKGIKNGEQAGANPTANGVYTERVARPSRATKLYRGVVEVRVPSNWKAFESGDTVQFAPEGAYGRNGITRGAMIGMMRGSGNLSSDAQAYINQILDSNDYLRQRGRFSEAYLGDFRGYVTTLSGRSPITGMTESVTIYMAYDDSRNFVYLAAVAPSSEASWYRTAFDRMLTSFRMR